MAAFVQYIEKVEEKRKRGGDRKSDKAKSIPSRGGIDKSSAAETAKKLGTSARQVERVRTVVEYAKETGETAAT